MIRDRLLSEKPEKGYNLLKSYLLELIAKALKCDPKQVDPKKSIRNFGLDQNLVLNLLSEVEANLGFKIPLSSLDLDFTISRLTEYLLSEVKNSTSNKINSSGESSNKICDYPLSHGQKALWIIQQLAPDSPANNLVEVVHVPIKVNIHALERTFQNLVDRHPALRTTFPANNGQPVQRVFQSQKVYFQHIDASDWSEEYFDKRLAEEVYRPFDLENGPLMRFMLFTKSPKDHFALLAMHHIITDLWSFTIFLQELGIFYTAEIQGLKPNLKPIPRQYSDYVNWQNKMLRGRAGKKMWRFWKDYLRGELPILNLPTDRPRPPIQTAKGASKSIRLNRELSKKLKDFTKKHEVSLFSTLSAAFVVFLHRYTNQEDIIIGTPKSGRNKKNFRLIGYFVNVAVIRGDVSGNPTFLKFLERWRKSVHGSLAHGDYPFDLIVEKIQPERDLSRTPVFQAVFAWQKTSKALAKRNMPSFALREAGQRMELGTLVIESMALEYRVAPFDLNMLMAESGEDILATLEYNTDLFDGATIERYLNHFQILLDGIVSTPDVPISVLPILSELELREGLLAMPDQAVDIPESECLHRLFEAQVQRAPDAIAVVLGAAQITYSELNHRSNQLARYLRRLGVGPEVLVGLWMERSIEMLIGIMGILKAGGAYLPMDLAYPAERVSFMLEDSQAPVVLTHQGLVENLPATTARVVCVDSDWELISQEPGGDLDIRIMPSNLIYVIYTSGSTGKPKGVQVTHKNVDRLFKSTQSWYNFRSADVWTLFHSYAFDFSVWEIWGGLLYGGKVVVVPYELSRFPEAFYDLLVQERVTVLNQTPSAFRQLIQAEEELGSSNDLSLRLVIFGGEALELQSLRPWFNRHGDTVPQLVNMYGITETTVHVTYRPITISDVEAGRGSVIGIPVPDLRVYVLDRHLQPVPIGVSGELYVGGGGVSRGYLNNPEISSDRFIPDPFTKESGALLYRTGDLGRYLNYGDIEYLGRIDYQVQVRGFRVELGEIESVLTGHPQVEESVVISREDPSGHERLVAYVVPTREGAPAVSTLREFLKTKLPDYMIPSVFMVLDKLPLTPHGKVDRKALPEPDQTKLELESIFVAPRTFEEQNLAKIWSEVLNLKKIGIYDNFFELGGDSILGIQVIGRANQSGLKLTPRHLFEYQTIADLAAAAGTGKTVTAEQGVVEGEVLLTPIQHWFFEQELPDSHHWNQAVLLEVRKPLNPDLLKSSVDFLIKHHDALRLRFRFEESEWKQLNAGVEDEIPFTKIDLSKLSVEEQRATVESKTAELQATLNLESGPLLHTVYFDLGEQQADRLFVVIHHLAIDGVSWRILLEDLQVIYRQQTQEKSVQLPPKSTSYQYWARKLVDYAQSDDVLREFDYWLKVSRGNQINIPLDFPDGHNIGATAKNITTYLSAEETHTLLHDVPAAYRTEINDVLLTALVHTFTRWMSSTELLIDLEGHGREDIFDEVDLSRTVGWFTTVYPVCLYLKDRDNLGNSLKSIKEQLRSIPRRGVGYGLLRYLNNDKKVKTKLHSEPPAEICFNYLGQFDQVISENSVFNLAKESIGPLYSPKAKRRYLIEINSSIAESQLQLTWTYSDTLHKPDTIQVLAQNFIDNLRSLISHCQSPDAGGYTASDFSDFGWDEKQLNNIVDRIKKTNK